MNRILFHVVLLVVFNLGRSGCAARAQERKHELNQQRAKTILDVSMLPASMHVGDCIDNTFTDVLVTCSVTLAPSDIDRILAAHTFEHHRIQGSTKSYRFAPGDPFAGQSGGIWDADRTFEVADEYRYRPAEYWGMFRVIVDPTRTRAILDLYIE